MLSRQKPTERTAEEEEDSWTPLIYMLLSTEPLWSQLPDPTPLFAEELLEAVLQAASQDAR